MEAEPAKRTFTVVGTGVKGVSGGRYVSRDPTSAARKAGRQIYKKLSEYQIKSRIKNGKPSIKFILRETTRDSLKKTFSYTVERKTLLEPVLVNGILRKYTYDIKSCMT